MKLLIATHNKSKLNLYNNLLSDSGINAVTLDTENIDIDVEESGNNPKENAIKKAIEYSKYTDLPLFAEDTGLYFENIEEDLQPGTHVVRVNGKRLNDDEILEYYVNLVSSHGGALKGYYLKDIALLDQNRNLHTFEYKVEKIFTSKVSEKRHDGYPLDSISITPSLNKYTVDLSDEENNILLNENHKKAKEFIINSLR